MNVRGGLGGAKCAFGAMVGLTALLAGSPSWAQTAGVGAAGAPSAQRAGQNVIPLTPQMIEELAHRYKATKRAEEQGATETAVPLSRQVNVSFAPGGAISIISTVKGYPTAVSFFDATGAPWPVAWDTNSDPAAASGGASCNAPTSRGGPSAVAVGFFVCTPTKGSNVLEITPMSLAPRGGLVVSLEGAPKPLTFLLVSGGGRYDADLSIHVAERGPNAKVAVVTEPGAPDTGAPFLTGMLEGVPPADAVPLAVEGVPPDGLHAWRLGSHLYLRTQYTLLSPEWTASESEAGMTVYAVPDTPVVLLSVNGRTVSAELKEQP